MMDIITDGLANCLDVVRKAPNGARASVPFAVLAVSVHSDCYCVYFIVEP